jgi:hypothetical protein
MLFELRGRGRKNTVRVIYILLAFLMGGGLVLFGIGGATSGGLVDAITGAGSSPDSSQKRFEKRETTAQKTLQSNPSDEAAYIDLVRAQISLAGTGDRYDSATNTYTKDGLAQLRKAVASWDKYQALNPKTSDEQAALASRMVQTFTSLGDAAGATGAQEIVAESRDSSGAYSTLAVLAYQAGQTRKGDLASKKALSKTDKDLRQQLKQQLDAAKTQGAASGSSGTQTTG